MIDLSSPANFRSLDHSSMPGQPGNSSSAAGQAHLVPPLELKFQQYAKGYGTSGHSEYTAGLKENPVILSQHRQPSEGREGRAQALNTVDEYFQYHKKMRNTKATLKDERRNSSQIQLQRIEGVVSPISSHKQRAPAEQQQRQETIASAQIELKPPGQLHRTNSAKASSLQQR